MYMYNIMYIRYSYMYM